MLTGLHYVGFNTNLFLEREGFIFMEGDFAIDGIESLPDVD